MNDFLELRVAAALTKSEAGSGRVRMDSDSRKKLNLQIGDVVSIEGKTKAVANVMKGAIDDEGKEIIRMDGIIRSNAGVSIDQTVKVKKVVAATAKSISIEPIGVPQGKKISFPEGTAGKYKEGLMNRPMVKGNQIVVPNSFLLGSRITFKVVDTVPTGIVSVGPDTELTIREGVEEKRDEAVSQVTYEDIGGLEDELRKIREMIELPIKHPELFDTMGISAPRGVLLYGPPGTGKTLIAKAVAKESGATFYSIQGPEIMGSYYGQSEERLRKIFEKANDTTPSIIFIDEIDSIAPNRNNVSGELERRVVAQLLTLMDGLSGRGDLIVIAATNREESIDPALRRPGRFDREIEIGIPGREGRKDILGVHLRNMPLSDDVKIDELANVTQGFVGADLEALCREAAMKCLTRNIDRLDLDKPIPSSVLSEMKVRMSDFAVALSDIEPSGMREVNIDIPKVQWSDVGGLESIKREIREVFIPTEEKHAFERLGVKPPKGLLLYGPPGTGKTLIAKAVANETGSNFICVNGPEIASKWQGETEKAVRQIFKRAKQMAPCIIFFDEIDSIAPKRGTQNSSWERVVNQLLTSMDGIESLNNVMVMAATNRPDMVDPALLRPGRFDKIVLIGMPNSESRLKILEVHTRDMPLEKVDLKSIAEKTEGFVGADLEALCREAGLNAFRENGDADKVKMKHFEAALENIKPSVDSGMISTYEKMSQEISKRKPTYENVPFYYG